MIFLNSKHNDKKVHMIRKQTYILPEQDRKLKVLARMKQVTEAELIREALEQFLRREGARVEDNPLLKIVGIGGDSPGPVDGALNHDRYLYCRE